MCVPECTKQFGLSFVIHFTIHILLEFQRYLAHKYVYTLTHKHKQTVKKLGKF